MDDNSANGEAAAVRISIRGVVQGVGFRPSVARAATAHRVAGWVLNGEAGVEIHAEIPAGSAANLAAFVDHMRSHPPPAARVSQFEVRATAPLGLSDFQIRHSHAVHAPTVRISPDLAICADCSKELADPADRRFEYPYINCTNCGPRYSIIVRLPYDRANTSMADWPLCTQCREEYESPLDRRYHAQPVACEQCGPAYRLLENASAAEDSATANSGGKENLGPIARAAELLRGGKILAVKGIGGYHLACDARNPSAVESLRSRKFRKERPFALMAADLEQAETLIELTDQHRRLLCDVARPIVVGRARAELDGVAPDNISLGVMLPYAPLHHLLIKFGAPSPMVLTSANRSSEPIAYRDADALDRLVGIADAFLIGGRPIARRIDDSVVAVRRGRPFMFRRSRGYSPSVVCRLPVREPILAVGSDLKNAIALVVDGEVLVSQHIGDLGDAETDAAFEETIRDLLAMYRIAIERVTIVHDLHPQFTSTRVAAALPAARRFGVQHHEAHVASVMAEHGLLDEPAVGVAFDGTGYARDGSIWGGEFFVGSVRDGFERVAWLRPVQMPGGDAAARFPAQAAAAFVADLPKLPELARLPQPMPKRFWDAVKMVARGVRCFRSSSMGRLFDAVAAILGFLREATYEGQAAIWLENQAARVAPQPRYPFSGLDHRPLLQAIVRDRIAGRAVAEIASAFHAAVAAAVVEQVGKIISRHRAGGGEIRTVALSGGVFQNELLLDSVFEQLASMSGLRVLTNEAVPVNDGGICLGQAALACGKY
ncbi:MAG TPA: carbamoyltransferase HypF [Pirellulales bacterium]|jgi:hydrogenase maturation protein HypF|nr:carbamoyltransferase HypF [Pirellulales bacterium]